jgi:hypothetical protein
MKKVVLVFGFISGAISAAMMWLTLPFIHNGSLKHSEVLGYTTIFLSFLLVFFGIRSYRENVGGGTISFGRGVAVGLLITLISCACYVASWEILYVNFMPDFMDKYAAQVVGEMHKEGAPAAAVAAKEKQLAAMKEWYKNPFVNVAMTFIEPFPVGLLMTLVSAAILRRRTPLPGASMAAQAV